ncbi:ADP-ribosylation factor(Arf)/Arf-like (Arl) small GTPase family protein (macronuclear) [Tetrahymena thermophila SB210]|uniref:ADP-ribosylation factor(Arf)/Arf-like (Arl) small GTPase family protein n=1 Tax=Tetrahymena thermophila (strain SB210) TaxID=312017 RepID=Q24C75_TETTS|nr:ADP-ribosylation factor(Arf)/Arf-like (Arl) small GTPase family protein [Tetrahymena thermophila SB210]EAS05363.1 ADP-ribosylation factor(Arf)/Arf-like (Arl) small GTPase family protein [Tetrahymena thermophila SB210]|eukprot:XP_001025608.1 ADP-ribosylation factor(Arf)/Arf-like (Arl) small GTPase family protein [Tetrahymena thermophila SB210]
MGQLILKALSALQSKKERKILMLGLDAAGKTTILHQMKLGQHIQSVPTIGFNVESVEYKNLKFTIWDIGGQWKLRQLWHHYFQGNNALIYVLDSTDAERMDDAKQALEMILSSSDMAGIPVLILANKQDVATMNVSEIQNKMQLHTIKGIGEWFIQGCCALNGEGIYDGLDWLSKILNKQQK